MKKKVLIKWIIGCGMLCMMLLVLWKRTHINYDEYSDKTSDMQHEEVEEIRFPDYINEKVSDGLVFDAEVVIGENFDPDNFYVSTARIMKPDEEKWNTLSVYEMFFLFDIGDDKVKFAPIDNIKECIKTKYGKTLDENCITVKKMVLGVYPFATDKEKNAVVPVWICFLERKTKGSEYVEKLYVPINAITGEEFYDMEG